MAPDRTGYENRGGTRRVKLQDKPSGSISEGVSIPALVELYSACRCLYYQHAIDRCASYGRRGHCIQQRTIYVGYACSAHTARSGQHAGSRQYSESGHYNSRSNTKSHR
ncbi:uncharacterized protein UV8b_07494 [Ustilaginoidea virens]|uniref:Uncharacterized protein n=1 Tax=Ustilaginoidea virens TaxID=1159556 RepID=A0A8E5MK41_USTVR|nr:uncharacterized protein UV8b_07494 [Ustilaginoidea virens]QUC23253.1 hypothetical protein UV8b_07494 [Ustilaginoidea virens]